MFISRTKLASKRLQRLRFRTRNALASTSMSIPILCPLLLDTMALESAASVNAYAMAATFASKRMARPTIEAYTQEAVKEAAKLIFNDYKALQNPEAHRSKPTGEIECDPTCVPWSANRVLESRASWVDSLVPSSSMMMVDLRLRPTPDDVQRIISILKDQNRDCLKWQDEQRRKREQKTTPETSDVSNFGDNPYTALAPETSPWDETKPLPVKKRWSWSKD